MAVFYRILWCIVAPFVRLFFPTRVIGRENMPKDKAILVCNHRSGMDIVLIDCCRVKRPYVLAKHTLFKGKLASAFFKALGAIPVNRKEVTTKTIRTAIKILEENNHLILFPEGTRKASLDETTALKNGMALFALKTNSPIVPMYLAKKPLPFVFNKLFIGTPLYFSEYAGKRTSKEVLADVSKQVLDAMQRLRTDYENSLSPKARERLEKRTKKAIERDKVRLAKKFKKTGIPAFEVAPQENEKPLETLAEMDERKEREELIKTAISAGAEVDTTNLPASPFARSGFESSSDSNQKDTNNENHTTDL